MITAKGLFGRAIDAQDGHIGSLHDLYFDDQVWTVRYLVIDTAKWLPGRKVLILPEATLQPWHGEEALPVKLTKDQIKSSPDIDTAQPISQKLNNSYTHTTVGFRIGRRLECRRRLPLRRRLQLLRKSAVRRPKKLSQRVSCAFAVHGKFLDITCSRQMVKSVMSRIWFSTTIPAAFSL